MEQTPTPAPTSDNFPIPLRTLVVDDSLVLLDALSAYFKTQPMFQVVGTAMNGRDGLHTAELLQPDLVLMDLHMPVMNGWQATEILRSRFPKIRIIVMTMSHSPTAETEARAHGAHGFVWKLRLLNDLITEVRRVFHPDSAKDETSGS